MNDPAESIIVEAYFPNVRVTGILKNAGESRRLIDVLNNQDANVELHSVESRRNGDPAIGRFNSILLRKNDLLYAVPRETAEQMRRRAFNRTGMQPASGPRALITVLTATSTITGSVIVPAGVNAARLELPQLARFFALTDASITNSDGSMLKEPVVIVHRDPVFGLSRQTA